jgi:hypothetical protein
VLDEKNTVDYRSLRRRDFSADTFAGKATVSRGGVPFRGVTLVLPDYRRPKVLVRRQADAVEIAVGMADANSSGDISDRSISISDISNRSIEIGVGTRAD